MQKENQMESRPTKREDPGQLPVFITLRLTVSWGKQDAPQLSSAQKSI